MLKLETLGQQSLQDGLARLHVCLGTKIHENKLICIGIYIHMCIPTYICMYIYIYIHIHSRCVCVHIQTCIYECIYHTLLLGPITCSSPCNCRAQRLHKRGATRASLCVSASTTSRFEIGFRGLRFRALGYRVTCTPEIGNMMAKNR